MNQSDSINEITKALAKAQSEMEGASKDVTNPFFKKEYATIEAVIAAIKIPLTSNGIAFTQFTDMHPEHGLGIVTQLSHISGQWMRGFYPIICKDHTDPQKLGSSTTYARRYSLKAAVALPDEDDDGNSGANKAAESTKSAQKRAAPLKEPAPPTNSATNTGKANTAKPRDNSIISDAQRKRLYAISKSVGADEAHVKDILAFYGFQSSTEITKELYETIVKDVEALKA